MREAGVGSDGMPKEMQDSSNVVTFGRQGGCYVTKGVAALLAILFVSALVATGVLVYYFVPQVRETSSDDLSPAPTSVSTCPQAATSPPPSHATLRNHKFSA